MNIRETVRHAEDAIAKAGLGPTSRRSDAIQVKSTNGAMVTTYRVEVSSIHETTDGSWMAWAEMVARRIGEKNQEPIGGVGVHVRASSREALVGKLRTGAI